MAREAVHTNFPGDSLWRGMRSVPRPSAIFGRLPFSCLFNICIGEGRPWPVFSMASAALSAGTLCVPPAGMACGRASMARIAFDAGDLHQTQADLRVSPERAFQSRFGCVSGSCRCASGRLCGGCDRRWHKPRTLLLGIPRPRTWVRLSSRCFRKGRLWPVFEDTSVADMTRFGEVA